MAAVQLQAIIREKQLKAMVPMDKFDIVEYGVDEKYSLATANLNSCHAVAIVFRKAAILAHIAPGAPGDLAQQFTSADAWVTFKIGQVVQCVKDNSAPFDVQGSGCVLVNGLFPPGKMALPDQVRIVAHAVQKVAR